MNKSYTVLAVVLIVVFFIGKLLVDKKNSPSFLCSYCVEKCAGDPSYFDEYDEPVCVDCYIHILQDEIDEYELKYPEGESVFYICASCGESFVGLPEYFDRDGDPLCEYCY